MRIALFATCMGDTMFPNAAKSTALLLTRLGHEVVFPPGQTCCGQMHVNTGYQPDALPLVANYADNFGDASIDAKVTLLTGEDPEFSAAFRAILGAYRRQAIAALDPAHPSSPDGFADTLIDMIVGSYVAELARADTVSDNWHTRIASAVGVLLDAGA